MKNFLRKILLISLCLTILQGSGVLSPVLTQAVDGETPTATDDSTSTDSSNTVTMPAIPHPDLLPGPSETADQEAVQNYFKNQAIPGFISTFLGLVAGLAVLSIIIAGIRFILAFGGEEGITAAKKNAMWATIGLGIAILAYALVSIINTISMPKGDYSPDSQQQIEYDSI